MGGSARNRRRGLSGWIVGRRSRLRRSVPPEISLWGAKRHQEVRCLSVGHWRMSVPISARMVWANEGPIPPRRPGRPLSTGRFPRPPRRRARSCAVGFGLGLKGRRDWPVPTWLQRAVQPLNLLITRQQWRGIKIVHGQGVLEDEHRLILPIPTPCFGQGFLGKSALGVGPLGQFDTARSPATMARIIASPVSPVVSVNTGARRMFICCRAFCMCCTDGTRSWLSSARCRSYVRKACISLSGRKEAVNMPRACNF